MGRGCGDLAGQQNPESQAEQGQPQPGADGGGAQAWAAGGQGSERSRQAVVQRLQPLGGGRRRVTAVGAAHPAGAKARRGTRAIAAPGAWRRSAIQPDRRTADRSKADRGPADPSWARRLAGSRRLRAGCWRLGEAAGAGGFRQRPADLLAQGQTLLQQLFVALLQGPDPLAELALEHLRQVLEQGLVAVPFAPGRLQLLLEGVVADPVSVGRFGHRGGSRGPGRAQPTEDRQPPQPGPSGWHGGGGFRAGLRVGTVLRGVPALACTSRCSGTGRRVPAGPRRCRSCPEPGRRSAPVRRHRAGRWPGR